MFPIVKQYIFSCEYKSNASPNRYALKMSYHKAFNRNMYAQKKKVNINIMEANGRKYVINCRSYDLIVSCYF